MKHILRLAAMTLLAATLTCSVSAPQAASSEAETPAVDPAAVLQALSEGNARFVEQRMLHANMDERRLLETSAGQQPLATVIACSDSRVAPEIVFDQGIGELFVIRVAGNVCDTDEIATAEYGTAHLGTPLLVVMGHTGCGAVTAVCTAAELDGSLPLLLDNIAPAVERAQQTTGLSGAALVAAAVEENVWQALSDLLSRSPIVAELVADGRLLAVGAVYDIASGEVRWLGEHPHQAQFTGGGSE